MMGNRLHISPVVVFIGLFIWGYLLGGIGALLAVPLTLLVITFYENFEGTRDLMALVRYTGEGKGDKEQRVQAMDPVRGWMERVKTTFRGGT
jgi:predicted PurR-regulated permease PerM